MDNKLQVCARNMLYIPKYIKILLLILDTFVVNFYANAPD